MFSKNDRRNSKNPPKTVSPQELSAFVKAFDRIAARIEKKGFDRAENELEDMLDLLEDDERVLRRFIETRDDERFALLRTFLPKVALDLASPLLLRSLKKLQELRPEEDLTREMDVATLACARRLYATTRREARERWKSAEETIDALTTLANEGNADAQFALALRYYFGGGVERDYARARELARQAEDQGLRKASLLRDLPRDVPDVEEYED